LENLGSLLSGDSQPGSARGRRTNIVCAMNAVQTYERSLSLELLRVLKECGATIYGLADEQRVDDRVPTFCFNLAAKRPAEITEALARAGIGIRDGHMYSPRLMSRLGLDPQRGAARISLVHYNTLEEIHRFREVLSSLSRNA
jgi:selenocysteine lyase/cysteine desulfurase